MLSLEFIEAEILTWAEEHRPTAYAQTLGVKEQRRTYRRYMMRLVELRAEGDAGWNPPIRLFEDTDVQRLYKMKDGREFTVSGRRCVGLRRMSWEMLAMLMEQDKPLDSLYAAIDDLDLFVADRDRDWPTYDEPELEPEPDLDTVDPEPPPEKFEQGDLLDV